MSSSEGSVGRGAAGSTGFGGASSCSLVWYLFGSFVAVSAVAVAIDMRRSCGLLHFEQSNSSAFLRRRFACWLSHGGVVLLFVPGWSGSGSRFSGPQRFQVAVLGARASETLFLVVVLC